MKKWNIGNLWKKYKYVGLVVLAGILLMLLPGKKTAADPQESGGSFSLEDTERRMEELLGRMDGVGRVQVMLTLKTGRSWSWRRTRTTRTGTASCAASGSR